MNRRDAMERMASVPLALTVVPVVMAETPDRIFTINEIVRAYRIPASLLRDAQQNPRSALLARRRGGCLL